MKGKKDAVIYARTSTVDKQEYESQIDLLERNAEYKKLNVVKRFGEKISGTIKAKERPEFSAMLEYIEENDIHHVLVTELSRLGRKMSDTINIIQDFNEKKICVHIAKDNLQTLNDDFSENKITGFIINILSGFADIERDYLRERSIRGARFNVSMGGAGGGIIKPYGFKKNGKKLEIDTEEAEIVRMIFNKYISGYSSRKIADLLNDQKVQTRYNKIFREDQPIKSRKGRYTKANNFKWSGTTIINILQNTIYYGKRKYKGEVFDVSPIIDYKTFEQAKNIREKNFNKTNNEKKYQNILKDKIFCPICNSGYFLHKRANNNDNAYKCVSKKIKEKNCGNVSINIDKLNNSVYFILRHAFKYQTKIDRKLSSKTKDIELNIKSLNSDISRLSDSLKKFEKRKKQLYIDKLDGQIDKEMYGELYSEIKKDIESLNDKIDNKSQGVVQQQKILQSLSSKENRDIENIEIFKKYIRDYISHIKIHDVTSLVYSGDIGKHFKVKNDVICLVELKSEVLDIDKFYLLSRYSKNLISLDLIDAKDFGKKIPYMDQNHYEVFQVGNDIVI